MSGWCGGIEGANNPSLRKCVEEIKRAGILQKNESYMKSERDHERVVRWH
jgi:hypothetical protein